MHKLNHGVWNFHWCRIISQEKLLPNLATNPFTQEYFVKDPLQKAYQWAWSNLQPPCWSTMRGCCLWDRSTEMVFVASLLWTRTSEASEMAVCSRCCFLCLPYSGKLWWTLNLTNESSEGIGEFLIWRLRAFPHSVIVYEIILASFKFGDFLQNRQFAKLKTSPNFPATCIWYIYDSPKVA